MPLLPSLRHRLGGLVSVAGQGSLELLSSWEFHVFPLRVAGQRQAGGQAGSAAWLALGSGQTAGGTGQPVLHRAPPLS